MASRRNRIRIFHPDYDRPLLGLEVGPLSQSFGVGCSTAPSALSLPWSTLVAARCGTCASPVSRSSSSKDGRRSPFSSLPAVTWGSRLSCCVEVSREVWRPVKGPKDGLYVPKGWQALHCHPPRTNRKSPIIPSPPHHRDHRSSIRKHSARLAPQGVGFGAPASQSSPVSVHPMQQDLHYAPRRPPHRVEDVSCSCYDISAARYLP